MKIFLTNILCILLVFSLIPVDAVFASDTSAQNHTSAIELLDSLDLLPDSYNVNSKISREKFISFLINAMGLGGVTSTGALPFDDVAQGSETYSAISSAYELGIINGNGKSFMPKETVSYIQAIKMLVSALGYGQLAEAKGGYPAGYMSVAGSIDLMDGLDLQNDELLKGSSVAILIYNALTANVMQIVEIGNNSVTYSDTANQTMLEVYHGITRFKGQLRGTKSQLLSGNYELESDQVLIDSSLYKTNGNIFDTLVGYSVYAYYSKNDNRIVAMEKVYTDNKVLVISADEISGYSSGYLKYDEGNKEKSIAINPVADIAYNGRPATKVNAELFDLNDGDITLIDSDGNGSYDAIIISDFENYVVSAVATTEKIIYDLYDSSKVLSIGETDEIFIDDFGNTMYYQELKKYDVISVWQSTDGKNIKMKFSNKEIKGTITEKSDDGYGSAVIDGEKLEFAKSFSSVGKEIELGSKGIFALDASGKIAAFKPSSDIDNYAYLLDADVGNSPLSDEFMIRVFTPQGSILIIDCDIDKLTIDGEKKTNDEAKAYFTKSQLIRYDVNTQGKVIMIDTAAPGTGNDDLLQMTHTAYDSDYKTVSDNRLRWSREGKLFSGKVPVASDVIVFNVPHPGSVEDDDEYYLSSVSEFSDATYVSFESYKTGDDSIISDVLIRYNLTGGGASITSKTPITVVDEVTSILNSNGDPTIKLGCYYNGGTYREYLFDDESQYTGITDSNGQPHTLVKGDIVRLNINENSGAIKKIELVYDRVDDVLNNGAEIGVDEYFVSERFVKGKVYEKEDNYISITQQNLTSGVELDISQKEFHVLYSSKILVYDSTVRGGELSAASLSDVRDFKVFGNDCSKVVIFSVDGGGNSIVVIYK